MIIWEDTNNDVSDLRGAGSSHLHPVVHGGKRGAVVNRAVKPLHSSALKSPLAMACEVVGRLLMGIIAICAVVMALAYLLPHANEGERDYTEPTRAEAFGWEVAR
jgi:hypothetical protein